MRPCTISDFTWAGCRLPADRIGVLFPDCGRPGLITYIAAHIRSAGSGEDRPQFSTNVRSVNVPTPSLVFKNAILGSAQWQVVRFCRWLRAIPISVSKLPPTAVPLRPGSYSALAPLTACTQSCSGLRIYACSSERLRSIHGASQEASAPLTNACAPEDRQLGLSLRTAVCRHTDAPTRFGSMRAQKHSARAVRASSRSSFARVLLSHSGRHIGGLATRNFVEPRNP